MVSSIDFVAPNLRAARDLSMDFITVGLIRCGIYADVSEHSDLRQLATVLDGACYESVPVSVQQDVIGV